MSIPINQLSRAVLTVVGALILHGTWTATAAAQTEPTKSEPTKSEPTKSEPTKSEPTKSEPTKSEPAQPVAKSYSGKPWFVGTTPADRRRAAELDGEGNELLKQHLFAEAMAKYQEALSHWDHPRIQYHLTIVRIELSEDPVATHESAQAALRYDGRGLTADERERARNYLKLLRQQLVELEVTCAQLGVQVKVAGKAFMTGPGSKRTLLKPGQYQITASKRGYIAVNQTVLLLPQEHKRVDLKLFTLADVSGSRRYWNPRMPWLVLGAGAAVAAVGGTLHWRAKVNFDRHDYEALPNASDCAAENGCHVNDEHSPEYIVDRANLQQGFAIAGYIAAGTTIATGLVLALVNRPRPYRIDRSAESFRVSVLPAVSAEGAGVSAAVSF